MTFRKLLEKYRKDAFSERDKGDKFERLIQTYLLTDPKYAAKLSTVWMWNEFPARKDFGGNDIGIDLVARTYNGDYWAIQCKCYQENTYISKDEVDSFLATSSKSFVDEDMKTTCFSHRLWVSTTNNWSSKAEEAIKTQIPPVSRIGITQLELAPVDWEKLDKGLTGDESRAEKKQPFPHQEIAVDNSHRYFTNSDRGKLIMACGTGKTFTSLKIAEKETESKGFILFLVPSIALLGQTLDEWCAQATTPINAICICSDAEISKKKKKNEDTDGYSVVDLALPASTDVNSIIKQLTNKRDNDNGMTVVFSTYQSIEVIAKAQKSYKQRVDDNAIFDMIICDEAHRTTGVTLADEDVSSFIKVHDNDFIEAKKRLYMTATPRIYDNESKSKADKHEALLCSMDDTQIYGEEIYRIGFGEAVNKGLLSDYKVLILTVSENDMPPAIQRMVANPENEISSDDASKLIGCINALSKQILGDANLIKSSDPEPMRRAVAFCPKIETSKAIAKTFNTTLSSYYTELSEEQKCNVVAVNADHIDGSMSATLRQEKLAWLKNGDIGSNECRVLTNVRCLSEGVDVPSLDAVLFLSARNSQVDVVQSVGRVMRKSPNKKYGYIIIPVVVPSDVEPEKALDDNKRYAVVWTVLNALRAHDDRFNAIVNKIELNKQRPKQITVGSPDYTGNGDNTSGGDSTPRQAEINQQLSIQFEQLQNVLFARMVQKVGNRRYWEQWAKDVAQIAERYIERINRLIVQNEQHRTAFDLFIKGLHKNINPSITQTEAIEMLSQHIITKPVFEALFDEYSFVKNNPISHAMEDMIELLEDGNVDKDTETLQKFYESVRMRAEKIDNAEGKQKIIVELYDKFFKTAFPKMVEKLGIVYTPIEVVDFIIHSVDAVLRKEFDRTISDENVNILDPFTGTGTFVTRLLQSGLIKKEDLHRKYTKEIFANEIVLLAYYIAAVNIENAYHDIAQTDGYQEFQGICLTDTFQLGESDANEKIFTDMFPQNSERVISQKKAPLRVILGNPPYSIGQKSANDNAQNQSYPVLDARVASTYAKESNAGLNKSLYDAYIKAFRWSTDRVDREHGGVIAFVSNGAWLDGNSTDGFRKSIEKEFSSIYVFNLRGNQRTSGELSRKEGGKIFGSGSRTPISITILVRKPKVDPQAKATIHYHDIGDYLSQKEKLEIIKRFGSIESKQMAWTNIVPNEHGDWINQRNSAFDTYIPLAPEKKFDSKAKAVFLGYSLGMCTNRDSFCYNSSKYELENNISRSINFYNEEREDYQLKLKENQSLKFKDVVTYHSTKLSWTDTVLRDAQNNIKYDYCRKNIINGLYRPFFKQYLYYKKELNHRQYQIPRLFPYLEAENKVICLSGIGASKEFSVLITNIVPNLDTIEKSQCFPLYYYDKVEKEALTLFDMVEQDGKEGYIRRDAISDFMLTRCRKAYGNQVKKEDIFYYVYGFLHSREYRQEFAADLKKMLPRIPLVDEGKDFWKFSKAGRALAELHLNYETLPKHPSIVELYSTVPKGELEKGLSGSEITTINYRVEKMRFASKTDKSTIHYNHQVSIEGIPAEAYDYIVNGKSAIEWIMERYTVTQHKESKIVNDPNDWATEHNNPRYILDLLHSVISLSVKSVEIIKGLPKIKF